jgi:hypothetical protein
MRILLSAKSSAQGKVRGSPRALTAVGRDPFVMVEFQTNRLALDTGYGVLAGRVITTAILDLARWEEYDGFPRGA